MGAWIETLILDISEKSIWSHPMWVRGLKHIQDDTFPLQLQVAPHVGAWIETFVRFVFIL